MYEPSAARVSTGCSPHISSVFTSGGAAPAWREATQGDSGTSLSNVLILIIIILFSPIDATLAGATKDWDIVASRAITTPISLLFKWFNYSCFG